MIIPFLTLVAGASQHQAEATSLLVILPTAIVATIAYAGRGSGRGLALRFGALGAPAESSALSPHSAARASLRRALFSRSPLRAASRAAAVAARLLARSRSRT